MSIAQRRVEPEWLDTLVPDDPRAIRSRADLRRIHRLMAARSLLGRPLLRLLAQAPDAPLLELGAGDGALALCLARGLSLCSPGRTLRLLDLQPSIAADTHAALHRLGWAVEVIRADVLQWLPAGQASANHGGERPIVFANLFVHHFCGERLQALLTGIAATAQAFVCLEPRRSTTALAGSRLLAVLGCNDVTRHDAVISVRAGFAGRELSDAWPDPHGWHLDEGAAGPFGHRLVATRREPRGCMHESRV